MTKHKKHDCLFCSASSRSARPVTAVHFHDIKDNHMTDLTQAIKALTVQMLQATVWAPESSAALTCLFARASAVECSPAECIELGPAPPDWLCTVRSVIRPAHMLRHLIPASMGADADKLSVM